MKRLVAFGCSLTQGQDLEKGVEYSRLAWPYVLGRKLNLAVTNNGKNGSSIKRIWWDIMNFDFHSSDTVVILWTHIDRWCIIKNDDRADRRGYLPEQDWDIPREGFKPHPSEKDDVDNIHHSMMNKRSEMWYKYFHDEHDIIQQGFLHINHADMYLKDKVKNIFHLRASENELNTSFNQVKFLNADIDDLRKRYPRANDDWHPGIECQEQYASQIKKEIQKSI